MEFDPTKARGDFGPRQEPAGASYLGGARYSPPRPGGSVTGRVPPHNLEAEVTVLGGLLLDNRSLDDVHELQLSPDDFYQESHQLLFEAVLELVRRGQPADAVTVANYLRNAGNFEKVGGGAYLAELVQSDFSVPNVGAYARIVKEKSTERKIILVCQEQSSKAFEGVEDHEAYREETEKRLLEATSERRVNTYRSLGDTLQDVFTHLQQTADRDSRIIGVPSGFADLDKETMGWHPGQLIIIAARPGMGKTSLMLNAALHASLQGSTSVAVFSMEMTRDELAMRLLSMEARVDASRLKNASRLQEQDWKHLQRAAGEMSHAHLFLDDTPALNILELKGRCRRIKNAHGLGLVIVDYLQLMCGLGAKAAKYSREQEISEISRGLKALAKELGVPVIAASQLSREVEKREGKPKLSDLRESGAIEQDADIVLFIHRDKDNPEMQREAELIIGKHRSGNTGEIKLAWHGQYTTFKDFHYGADAAGPPDRSAPPDIF